MNTLDNHLYNYDSPWKAGMELYFKEPMQFFFPDIAAQIAWAKRYQFLDKELQQVVRMLRSACGMRTSCSGCGL